MKIEEQKRRTKGLYLALSILVALGIWLFVDQISGPNGGPKTAIREITDVPIVYVNEAGLEGKGLMMLEDGTDSTLDLTVEGTRWDVSSLDVSDIRIAVNLSQVTSAGKQSLGYDITFPNSKFSENNITITKASRYNAAVNISELYSRKVDIRCEVQGNVADGFSAGQIQLSHTSVEIQGQQENVDPISYAKVVFDIGKNAEESVTKSLSLLFFDEQGRFLKDPDVKATVSSVQATLPVFVTKELALNINFLESEGARRQNLNYEIQPSTITVSGDAGELKNVNSITLDEFDLLTLAEGVNTYTYPITVPSDCQNLSGVTRATLVISFKDMTHAAIPTNRFRPDNLPAGRIVNVLTQQIAVQVFGTNEDVGSVTGENLVVTADLSAFGAALGTYTVPAVIENESGRDIGIIGTYEIQVSIQDPEEAEEPENPEETPENNPEAPENP